MVDITRAANVSLATSLPCHAHQVDQGGNKRAGAAIAAGDICYIKASDAKVYPCNGTSDNEAAVAWGIAARAAAAAEPVTLYKDVEFEYAAGLTIGAPLYVSAATAGALADASSTGGDTVVARPVSATRIRFKGDL